MLLVAALVVVLIVGFIALRIELRRRATKVIASRGPLTADEFANLFATENERRWAPVVRDRLRAYIPVDPSLVRPDDQVCRGGLQLAAVDGLDANRFVREIEELVGVKIPADRAAQMYTLRDIVSYIAVQKQ